MDSPRVATKSSRAITPLTGLAAACALLLLGPGCGDDGLEPGAWFRMIGPPLPVDGRCTAGAEPSPAFPDGGADLVRLTFSTGDALLCDLVLDRDEGDQVIAIPSNSSDLVDLDVEYFTGAAPTATRVGRGRRTGLSLAGGATADVSITWTDRFACAAEPAGIARAFHSATRLPTGEVLLLGGAVAAAGEGEVDLAGDGFLYATAEAEMYDPVDRRFRPVTVTGLLPRVMHRAVIVASDDASVDVALVGGLTVAGDAATTPVLAVNQSGRVVLPATADAVGAPLQIVHYDLATSTLSASLVPSDQAPTPRLFGAATGQCGSALAVAGGWTDPAATTPLADFQVITPAGIAVTSSPLLQPRFGAAAACLASGQALLWGGHLDADSGALESDAGELLSGLDTATPISIRPGFSGSPPTPRAFAELAPTGDGDLLAVGGFAIADHQAVAVAPSLAQRLTPGDPVQVADVTSPDGTVLPAGFASATPLHDGDVLISGGTPAACSAKLVCSLGQGLRFRDGNNQLASVGALVVDRYGHRTTALSDGTVLVTGGLHAGPGSLELLSDTEIFDPRETDEDPLAALDPSLSRLPGDVARDPDGEAVAPCEVVEAAPEASDPQYRLYFHIRP